MAILNREKHQTPTVGAFDICVALHPNSCASLLLISDFSIQILPTTYEGPLDSDEPIKGFS